MDLEIAPAEATAMRFAHPALLLLIPVLIALILGTRILQARRDRRRIAAFSGSTGLPWSAPGWVPWRQRVDYVMVMAVAILLPLALARPLAFRMNEQSELRGVPYMIALDLSRSMLATDVRPNRWFAATNALSRFLDSGRADRVGLITFSGVAYLNAPLSFDTRAIQAMLRYASPYTVEMDGETAGSNLGSAIERAGRYFQTNNIQPRVVILVTDGEDSGEQLLEFTRRWARQGVKVCAVGVGTRGGSKVPRIQWGGVAKNNSGQEVVSRLNEANLKRITALTGGRYVPLGDQGEGFTTLRQEFLAPLAESAAREDTKNYIEAYPVPLSLAIAALITQVIIGARRHQRPRSLSAIRTTPPPVVP
jgi:Ca-activated chloride channel family protein